jgi:hypothetical protein
MKRFRCIRIKPVLHLSILKFEKLIKYCIFTFIRREAASKRQYLRLLIISNFLIKCKISSFQGEFAVKLEIESASQADKGSYKLVAKNEKGEATSQTVEVTEIPEEEEVKKGNKPEFSQGLTSVVSTFSQTHINVFFHLL